MRIVRHPNIVELKAFYYSNGERVSKKHFAFGLERTVSEWKSNS